MSRPLHKDKLLGREQLEKLTTKRLLAYKNSLLRAVEGSPADIYGNPNPNYVSKQTPEWQTTMNTIREILNSREHIERDR